MIQGRIKTFALPGGLLARLMVTATKVNAFRDPVCGMEYPLAKSAGHVTYKGTRYDFCSHECLMKFQAGPEPYVNPPEVA